MSYLTLTNKQRAELIAKQLKGWRSAETRRLRAIDRPQARRRARIAWRRFKLGPVCKSVDCGDRGATG